MASGHPETSRPAWPARLPFFYGWAIVGAVFVIYFLQIGVQLWALSVFVGPMTAELTHWTRSDIFSAVTVRTLITAAAVPFVGRFLDRRHGAFGLTIFSAVLGSAVLVGTARVQEPWEFMVLFGVLGGIANVGQGAVVGAAIVPKWFVRKRAHALALSTTGGGAGALVMPLVAAATIGALGWREAWVVFGVGTALVTLPLALLMRRQPEDVGLLPDGAARPRPGQHVPPPQRSFTAREAFKVPATWLLVLAVGLASLPNIGLPANIVPLYVDRGFSQTGGAFALSTYGLMSVTARYVWGYIAAVTDVRTAMMALVVFGAIVTAALAFVDDNAVVLLLLAGASGLAIGGMIVLIPLVWPAYLGRGHLGAITGIVFPLNSLWAAAGPLVLAQSYDRLGDYQVGLLAMTAGYVGSLAALFFLKPPQR